MRSKIKPFRWHEVAQNEYDLVKRAVKEKDGSLTIKEDLERTPARRLVFTAKWDDLTDVQQAGLDEKMVVRLLWIEKRFFMKDVLVLHCWLIGCSKPLRWVESKKQWMDCN